MVLHFAGEDKFAPPEARGADQGRVRRAQPAVEIYVYPGVDHAFARTGGDHYDKPAAMMAHSRSLALLRRVMGPHYDLSALWDAALRLRVRHPRRRRDHGDHGGRALRQPHPDHDRRRRPRAAGALLPAPFHPEAAQGHQADPDLAHHRRRPRGGRDAVLLHPRQRDRLDAAGRRADRQVRRDAAGRHRQLPRRQALHEHIYWDQARCWCRSGCSTRRACRWPASRRAKKLLDRDAAVEHADGRRGRRARAGRSEFEGRSVGSLA